MNQMKDTTVTIDEDDLPNLMSDLQRHNSHSSHFEIKNYDLVIYEHPQFPLFCQSYGANVKQLKLQQFFDFQFECERDFFESLPNLEELEIFVWKCRSQENVKDMGSLPACFDNLKSLKIDYFEESKNPYIDSTDESEDSSEEEFQVRITLDHWIWRLMDHCPKLEMLQFPHFWDIRDRSEFIEYVVCWMMDMEEGSLPLKSIDVKFYALSDFDAGKSLWEECGLKNVKMLNVGSDIFIASPLHPQLGQLIISLRISDLNELPLVNVLNTNLPNLERMDIDFRLDFEFVTQSPSSFSHLLNVYSQPPLNNLWHPSLNPLMGNWPNLKSIELDWSTNCEYEGERVVDVWTKTTAFIFKMLNTEERPTVTSLLLHLRKINIELKKMAEGSNHQGSSTRKCDIPEDLIIAANITTNFPNLTSLTIVGWDADDRSFARLWRGLPKLKSLHIGDCSALTDRGFIGGRRHPDGPAFFMLTNLRSLTLNLSYMPLVTDTFFKEILRQVPLKELIFEGETTENVTINSIALLFGGKFASTIERFPFHSYWPLRGESSEEILKLKSQFPLLR